MAANAARTHKTILDAAFELFYRRGFNRVGVDEVAAAAGVTKRTLYAHFDSKDTLVAAVLEAQHDLSLERIRRWGDTLNGTAADIIDRVFEQFTTWTEQPGWTGIGYTRLALELADLPGHPVRAIAARHKSEIEAWLTDVFARAKHPQPDSLAREVCLLVEGANALVVIYGDSGYARVAATAAKALAGKRRAVG